MLFQLSALISILFMASIAAAHGKVASVTGDAGGNGTALGIIGGIVPGAGSNDVTEIDTTVFKKRDIATNGLGKTMNGGKNTVAMVHASMAMSGDTLPQVSEGGFITGTFHIITTDGAGPISAMIDPSASGKFAQGDEAEVAEQVPGKKGNIKANGKVARALQHMGLLKRAANVNKTFPFNVTVPAGTTCHGAVAGLQNVCFMKIANANAAGPFGGVIAFQMVASSAPKVTAAVVSRVARAVVDPAARAAARANVRTDMNAAIGATMARRFVA